MTPPRTRSRNTVLLCALSLLVLGGCAGRAPSGPEPTAPTGDAFPVTISAAHGPLRLDHRPRRIVSLDASNTEILYAVGAGSQVVAVDKYSDFPAGVPKTDLSGLINIEAIAKYNPDLVVTGYDTDHLSAQLAKLKIPTLLLPAAKTLPDAYASWQSLGRASGHAAQAGDLVRRETAEIAGIVAATPKPATPLSYYHELDSQLHTATSSTFIGQVYALFGLRDIADGADPTGSGYPRLSGEQVISADPNLIFLADTRCCAQNSATVAVRAGWPSLTAVRNGDVFGLDDDSASRWGPRIVDLVRAVSNAVRQAESHRG